jgi:hypothetical protein
MDYDYSTGMPLTSNVFPSLGSGASGNYLTGTSNGLMWSNPTYVDDHLTYSGGVSVYQQHKLRQQHPALLEAWENYLAILYLCNDQ